MYLIGFLTAWFLVKQDIKRSGLGREHIQKEELLLDNLMLYLILGVIVGGRLGYCLFYNLSYYASHPLEIFATWHGGMSFHGGALGAALGGAVFCWRKGEPFFKWADRFVWPAPIGLFFGRLGNFINGELYGRVTDVPWAMVFPAGGPLPRHPSQLYEAILEGPLLFGILTILKRKDLPQGWLFASFFIGYGVLRFMVEFVREPDPQLGFIAFGWMTMGQVLSLGLIVFGLSLLFMLKARSH